MKKADKPPIGLIPKFVRDTERLDEIKEAIVRYLESSYEIPIKWIEEYNKLAPKKLFKREEERV